MADFTLVPKRGARQASSLRPNCCERVELVGVPSAAEPRGTRDSLLGSLRWSLGSSGPYVFRKTRPESLAQTDTLSGCARALRLQPVRDQRPAGIEFEAHELAASATAEVTVVEGSLEPARDLPTVSADQRPDVTRLEVPVAAYRSA